MGIGASKLSKSEQKLVDQSLYIREGVIPEDKRYGQGICVYHETNSANRVAILTKEYKDEMEFDTTFNAQQSLVKLNHIGMIRLLNVIKKEKSSLCQQPVYSIKFLYDYIEDDLEQEFSRRLAAISHLKAIPLTPETSHDLLPFARAGYHIPYDESELWYIAATTLAVLAYLAQNRINHGDIRPSNLTLTPQNNIKVMGVNSVIKTNWSSYLEKLENIPTKSTYISPIQLGALQHKVQRPSQNTPKSDVFCLGIILLECALMESAQDIYDTTTYRIDLSKRVTRIREKQNYSKHLLNAIVSFLTLDETNRPTPEQAFQSILELANSSKRLTPSHSSPDHYNPPPPPPQQMRYQSQTTCSP